MGIIPYSTIPKSKMMKSPFKYGSIVSNKAFINRKKEIEKLFINLTSGINTTIISPRRWGKSSLVEKVFIKIDHNSKRTKTLIIDLFSVQNEEEFLELFAREIIKASSTKWEEWVKTSKNVFKNLIPKISFGLDPLNEFNLSFEWEELLKHKDEILDLPEVIAKKKSIKFIIALDEFQNIANFTHYEVFEKKMRSKWQRHKNVTYCLFGSKRHMMADIFNNSSKPFYRFGDIILLEKIKTEDWVGFIIKSYKSTGKLISRSIAQRIPYLMQNHSWYVQQLAHYTWYKTENKTTIENLNSALFELINANSPLYQKEVETLSKTQLNLLKAISQGEIKLTSVSVMNKYKLGTPRNVSKNKLILQNNDIIDLKNSKFEFLDPAFEIWFLKLFFNQKYIQT